MKLANLDGRAVLITDDGAIDLATASDGRFGPDVQAVYDDWAALTAWVAGLDRPAPRPTTRPTSVRPCRGRARSSRSG